MEITAFIIPTVIIFIVFYALLKKTDVFAEFISGAKDGMQTALNILPSLIILMTSIAMFKASGGLQFIVNLLSPIGEFLGIPSEVIPLAILRPLSGSGALSYFEQILSQYGPSSLPGMVASTMMGSTETTFYVVAVYFGAIKITKTRHTVPCALFADLTGFILSALFIRLLFFTC